ncbi:hypothetical protein H0X09_00645 [Candidatus Saccharibacteria bacterium]|nr:hypothetical protein [Candidatus Saccharibacteria bacterium]
MYGKLLVVVLLGLILYAAFAYNGSAKAATSTTSSGFPLDLKVTSTAKIGSLKVGTIVPITVVVRNIGPTKLEKLEVGFPVNNPPMNPSKPLTNPVRDLSIWAAGPLGKGLFKKLTFNVIVQVPPDAKGAGMWCLTVYASPALLKGPPAWSMSKDICYRVVA